MPKDTRRSGYPADVAVPDWLLNTAVRAWQQNPSLPLNDRMRAVLVEALTEYRIAYWPEEG
ncbi:hypothetical protein ACIBK9_47270 [Nonomuraea sp. NPDC050227]|uniref:hypothetical protein n=1 Tax=Nonomuraea sp. NPDC050227 TaxID=3364360 RepID=UPI003792C671